MTDPEMQKQLQMLEEQSMPLLQEARNAFTGEPSYHPPEQSSQRMSGYPGMGHLPDVSTMTRTQLQDYQMQLMLLEHQNKKRLLTARQEQDRLLEDQEDQEEHQFHEDQDQSLLME